ncbi:MAG: hypothetical protein R3257_02270 [bacterium]|nr:hypothetical protein [bacterium]
MGPAPVYAKNLPLLMESIPDQIYRAQGMVGADGQDVYKARQQLRREAAKMDADAVVWVRCESGGLKRQGLTWAKVKAHCRGMAIKYPDDETK